MVNMQARSTLAVASLFAGLFVKAQGISLQVSENGGNASSPLLYGFMFEVIHRVPTPLVPASYHLTLLIRTSIIQETEGSMGNCCKTTDCKAQRQISRRGVKSAMPQLRLIPRTLCHLQSHIVFDWTSQQGLMAQLVSQTPDTGGSLLMEMISKHTSGSRAL